MGDPIRYLNRLPHLCNFSPIIGKITVCSCGCLLASALTRHTTSNFTRGCYDIFISNWPIIVRPRHLADGTDWRLMQARRWLNLGIWTFDLVHHRLSPRATMALKPYHLKLCRLSTRGLPEDHQSHWLTALEASTTTPASSSMPPPSSTTQHKQERQDTCDDVIDTPKVWTAISANSITLISSNDSVGSSSSERLSLACNGVCKVNCTIDGDPSSTSTAKTTPHLATLL